ncbi:MAG: type II secretion system protein GspG [Gemmataceae bacterium]|nr:type II secretion system protein GspG [Gemmataceae bacterium]
MKLAPASTRAARRAGFTLLEVLVVVAILVILAGVGVVATTSYLERAKRSEARLKCNTIAGAVEAYYLNNQQYPETLDQLLSQGGGTALKNGQQDLTDPWGKRFNYQVVDMGDGSGNGAPIVWTTANDGTKISQHGEGQASRAP